MGRAFDESIERFLQLVAPPPERVAQLDESVVEPPPTVFGYLEYAGVLHLCVHLLPFVLPTSSSISVVERRTTYFPLLTSFVSRSMTATCCPNCSVTCKVSRSTSWTFVTRSPVLSRSFPFDGGSDCGASDNSLDRRWGVSPGCVGAGMVLSWSMGVLRFRMDVFELDTTGGCVCGSWSALGFLWSVRLRGVIPFHPGGS